MKGKTVGLRSGTALVPKAKTPGKKGSLRVAAVQMRFAQTIPENLQRIDQATAAAAKDGVDVILFPECATTGYACDFGTIDAAELRDAIQTLGFMAAHHQVQMLVGSP
ncbi:MAG: Carbon-nitrogen hydrolase, partial [Verrucomicrobiota bacterium]